MNQERILSSVDYLSSDLKFNLLYPKSVRLLAQRHWTPVRIARWAAEFLGREPGSKILDIGSGVGKFCLAGSLSVPGSDFFGIEQREYLIDHALEAQETLCVNNAHFLHGNFTQVDFSQYDHFYFFNSFYENLDDYGRIDEMISYSEGLYEYYARHLYNGLRSMPKGTKIASYHTLWHEIPTEYRMVESLENGALNFWIRK